MQFELDADQELLARSVEQILTRSSGRDRWAELTAAGILGGTEAMIVMEAIGRVLADEPYLSCVLLAGNALLEAGGHDELLGRLTAGECKLTLAHSEPQSWYDLAHVVSTSRKDGESWILNGVKIAVLDAASADVLLVSACAADERGAVDRGLARADGRGVTLFAVDRGAPGISVELRTGPDGRSAGNFTLRDIRVPDSARVGAVGDGVRIVRAAVDKAIAGACAEAVGAMSRLLDITIEHLKTRKQFGAPIGSFQALQHRAADMLCELEQARSMALYAALMCSDPDTRVRRSAIAAAKIQVSAAARFVGQQAIQLHGGMGMSEEYPAGRYFKRLTLFERLFGDENHFLRQIDLHE
jgi:alkylation response protein AidB-like acyl-CoA dehydrogenase